MIHVGKLLQMLGILILLEALYIGILHHDMNTELALLLAGIAIFYLGTWIHRNRRR